jgi:putative membrane protein
MAYNQGFYNLFLAIGAVIGVVIWAVNGVGDVAGRTLLLFSLGSMAAAALVLVTSGRKYLRPAAVQGTLPLIGLVLTILA